MDWEIASSLCAILMTFGGLIAMWWKVKADSAALKKEVSDHAEKIVLLITNKANCSDMIKLSELVDTIDKRVSFHHEDTRRHRTEDFEARIEAILNTVQGFMRENKEDHDKIIQLIRGAQK